MEYLSIVMIREDLDAIPQYDLPSGYSVRSYQRGDRQTWLRIWEVTDQYHRVSAQLFDDQFGKDHAGLEKRCCFLVAPEGQDIGTATAWHQRDNRGRRWGVVHWVAVTPEYQSKGLSRPLLTACLNQMRKLQHRRARLMTQTPRIPAIKAYLRFGFVPDLSQPDARAGWQLVAEHICHPALTGIQSERSASGQEKFIAQTP